MSDGHPPASDASHLMRLLKKADSSPDLGNSLVPSGVFRISYEHWFWWMENWIERMEIQQSSKQGMPMALTYADIKSYIVSFLCVKGTVVLHTDSGATKFFLSRGLPNFHPNLLVYELEFDRKKKDAPMLMFAKSVDRFCG